MLGPFLSYSPLSSPAEYCTTQDANPSWRSMNVHKMNVLGRFFLARSIVSLWETRFLRMYMNKHFSSYSTVLTSDRFRSCFVGFSTYLHREADPPSKDTLWDGGDWCHFSLRLPLLCASLQTVNFATLSEERGELISRVCTKALK